MNNLERIFEEANNNIEKYTDGYLKYLCDLFIKIDRKLIADFVRELEISYRKQKTIFIIGNGGSGATASHMANDMGIDIHKKAKCNLAFRALALTDNSSVMTAISNDNGYENLFVNQLRIHYRAGDMLIAISASGNSLNVVKAVQWVRAQNGVTIGLTGFDGGKLKEICDLVINVDTPQGDYGPVEDIHLILNHLVATWLQYSFKFKEKQDRNDKK